MLSDSEKLARLRKKLDPADTTSDEIANAYLKMAEEAVINLAFPFWQRFRGNAREVRRCADRDCLVYVKQEGC